MKVEWRTILGASIFLGATGAVYWALKNHPSEAAGVTMLIFGFAAYGMLFSYLLLQYNRRQKVPRPEDRFDATHADGAGIIGHFPSASIWPAGMGLGLIFGGVALIYGGWYLVVGAVIFIGAIIGFTVEAEAEEYEPETEEEAEHHMYHPPAGEEPEHQVLHQPPE